MASTGHWEVVGKTKKGKGQAPALTKSQKKQFVEKMPRIDTRDPVKEDSTIYDAFKLGESRQEVKTDRQNGYADVGSKKNAQQAKKKKPEQNGKRDVGRPITLESALAQIDQAELESILSQSQLRFPDNQDVWLKDLASYINLKLEKVTESHPTFKDKDKGYPMNQLSGGSRQVINGLFKKCSKQSLDHLFYHCVQCMLAENAKGTSTAGYKVFLQLLAHQRPNIVLPKLPQYLELLKTHQNRPTQCLTILWALGQCGIVDLRCGLRVWMDLMLPCLGIRSVAAYPVEYLENLFKWHKDAREAYGEVSLREYFYVLDSVFSPTFNLPSDLRKRLQEVYPKIKEIAYGASPATNLRNFFASYLRRAEPNSSLAMKQEVLLCLVLCLVTDKHCWSTWCQMYTKHLVQSGVLLQHFLDSWEVLGKSDRHMLRQTLRSFAVTNDELSAHGRTTQEGFDICNVTTKELLNKMSESRFPWGMVVFFFVSVFAAIVAYDVISSPSVRASRTVRFMEDYGLLGVMEQAWRRIMTFVYLATGWMKENFPRYYAWVQDTVGPFVKQMWRTLVDTAMFLVDAARPHYRWAVEKTHQALLWVGSAPFLHKTSRLNTWTKTHEQNCGVSTSELWCLHLKFCAEILETEGNLNTAFGLAFSACTPDQMAVCV
ncbi:hypothetical protein BaRGS_00023433 [Batillaria attramentaria]|uniref:Transmembrane protein 214 n=1 Tax=Batillaria attramentaria TaxID=370345 RepID=A0ABD0KDY8_9CAEN